MSKPSQGKEFQRVGMVARWKPVHLGHVPVLHGLCDHAEQIIIGIGSSNRYDFRNPFTLEETIEMLHIGLTNRKNYTLIPVPDLDDGPRWRMMIMELFGKLDCFVTDNPYVSHLLSEAYHVQAPIKFVGEADRVRLNGTMVRRSMAQGDEWQELVPKGISEYIINKKLDLRFRQEFGLQTIALETIIKN